MADYIIDDAGVDRMLGTLVPAAPPSGFKLYADSGKPMFTLDTIRKFGTENDTKGRSRFDSSWIMDQRSHGSCNGYAGASALSRARVRRMLPRVDLSGAYLYSLINGGRDDGSMLDDGMREVQNGLATRETVGWDAIYPSRYDRAKAKAEAARFKAHECYQLRTQEELFSALMADFDCVVAVHVGNSFMRLDGDGVCGGDRGPGNHAVCVDGFTVLRDGTLCADLANSWNLTFGDQGRGWLTWSRHFAQTVGPHGFYAIRSASDDPEGDNPPDIVK